MNKEKITQLIEQYRLAIISQKPQNVADLFHPEAQVLIHSISASGAWAAKKATGNTAVKKAYTDWFSLVSNIEVQYQNRIIDEKKQAMACVVEVSVIDFEGKKDSMRNALHWFFKEGKIYQMENWYGQ